MLQFLIILLHLLLLMLLHLLLQLLYLLSQLGIVLLECTLAGKLLVHFFLEFLNFLLHCS